MRELSLFTGIGGGVLGTSLLGWETVGYVEWDSYCCQIIEQRIRDELLRDAPIFYGDIRRWIELGYPAAYTGLVDIVSAGFPCQPFAVGGKRRGEEDHRNMWPETIQSIRIIKPTYIFLENVPGLLTSGYFERILQDLSKSGYGCRWRSLSAEQLGAPHKRERLWIFGFDTNGFDAYGEGESDSSYSDSTQWQTQKNLKLWKERESELGAVDVVEGFDSYSDALRILHGIPNWMDRHKTLGNTQIPAMVVEAWMSLTEGIL